MRHLMQGSASRIDTDKSLDTRSRRKQPTTFQNGGIAASGQETPEINNKMTDVKTNTNIGDSRLVINPDSVIDIKIQANR